MITSKQNKFEDHFTFSIKGGICLCLGGFICFFWGGGVGANYSSSISHLSWMFLFPRPKHGHVEESELAAEWNVVSKEKRLHIYFLQTYNRSIASMSTFVKPMNITQRTPGFDGESNMPPYPSVWNGSPCCQHFQWSMLTKTAPTQSQLQNFLPQNPRLKKRF